MKDRPRGLDRERRNCRATWLSRSCLLGEGSAVVQLGSGAVTTHGLKRLRTQNRKIWRKFVTRQLNWIGPGVPTRKPPTLSNCRRIHCVSVHWWHSLLLDGCTACSLVRACACWCARVHRCAVVINRARQAYLTRPFKCDAIESESGVGSRDLPCTLTLNRVGGTGLLNQSGSHVCKRADGDPWIMRAADAIR